MIVGMQKDGRKIRVCLSCDGCGKRTQPIWVWDLRVFFDGKEKRDVTRRNRSDLRDLADCEDYRKHDKRHLCARCFDARPVQAGLPGVV